MSEPLRVEGLARSFRDGTRTIEVLRGIDLTLQRGERVAVVGPSGSGKSTLLHLLGLLDTPTAGTILLGGRPVSSLSERERAGLRNRSFGFVFQAYHLLPEFNAVENVEMSARMMSTRQWLAERRDVRRRACELLEQVGLSERLTAYPATLSGGERQRVAIARALVNDPEILLCDEPTGNLDERTSREIFDLLGRIHERRGHSAVIVTHEVELAQRCDRILHLEGGVLH